MTLSTKPGVKVRGVFEVQSTGLICVIMMPAAAAAVSLSLQATAHECGLSPQSELQAAGTQG